MSQHQGICVAEKEETVNGVHFPAVSCTCEKPGQRPFSLQAVEAQQMQDATQGWPGYGMR